MTTHSGILAWKIPWTEEPGGLQSLGSHIQTCSRTFSFLNIYIILFLALLGLCCFEGFSLVVVSRDYSLVAGPGLLIAVASLVGEHGL